MKEYLQFEAALSLPALPPEEALAALRQRGQTLEMEIATLDDVQALAKDIESGQLTGIDQWLSWYAPGGERSTDENTGPGTS